MRKISIDLPTLPGQTRVTLSFEDALVGDMSTGPYLAMTLAREHTLGFAKESLGTMLDVYSARIISEYLAVFAECDKKK
jgi:hypothetical protein